MWTTTDGKFLVSAERCDGNVGDTVHLGCDDAGAGATTVPLLYATDGVVWSDVLPG